MRNIALKFVIVTLSLTVVGLALGTTEDNETLSQIAGYRNWTRVTPKPYVIALDLSSVAG
jgi:hypothetical protein